MDSLKIQVKHDQHEFTAEGSESTVRELLQGFLEVVKGAALKSTPPVARAQEVAIPPASQVDSILPPALSFEKVNQADLDKVFKREGEKLRLRIYPDDDGDKNQQGRDSMLLALLGLKAVFGKEDPSSVAIADVLRSTGIPVTRLNDVAVALIKEGFITKMGMNRATTYRITTRGSNRAEEIIVSLRMKY